MGETVLFKRYRLIEPVGAGGSAQVWHAIDEATGDDVAVKRLHPIVFADDAGQARLRREFEALRSLDEPHIVRVRDLVIADDDAALILDYVPGRSLAERLASGPQLTATEAVSIAADVAAALAAAHAAGLVHRDVTPGNVLLDPKDGARLTDFGIALGGAEISAVTATGQLMGTLRYLAPEQLRGEPATVATDIHSLGAVVYEMLAGRPPYEATTPVALIEAHTAGAWPIQGVDPALDLAVRRALAPDPAQRPADAAAFAASLEEALTEQRTVAIPLPPMPAAVPVPPAAPVSPAPAVSPVPPELEPAAGPAPSLLAGATPRNPKRPRQLAAPIAAVFALIFAGLVVAALSPSGTSGSVAPAGSPAPPAAVSPDPTAVPADGGEGGEPKDDDKGKGKGNGNGNGKGNGNDDD